MKHDTDKCNVLRGNEHKKCKHVQSSVMRLSHLQLCCSALYLKRRVIATVRSLVRSLGTFGHLPTVCHALPCHYHVRGPKTCQEAKDCVNRINEVLSICSPSIAFLARHASLPLYKAIIPFGPVGVLLRAEQSG